MNPDLRATLLGRRLVVASVIALFTGLFFGGMVGFAAAGEPATEIPETFGVPPVMVGDRGVYNASIVERGSDGAFTPLVEEREAARFEWLPPRDMLDGEGTPRRVNELRHGKLSFYMSTETGFISLQNEKLAEFGLGEIYNFDAQTGQMVATGMRTDDGTSHLGTTFLPAGTSSSNLPLCGLVNPLQGNERPTDERVALFQRCNTPAEANIDQEFKAAATEQIDGRDCVVYARVDWLGWATGDDEEAYVWMCAEIPYPVRMALEDPHKHGQFVVYRLTGWTRGTVPLATGPPSDSLQAAPEPTWAPRTGTMFSEEGLSHPFPLSAALSYARNDAGSARVRDFISRNADAYVVEAHYEENVRGAGVDRFWWFVLGNERDWVSIGVVRTEESGVQTHRYENRTESTGARLENEPLLPAKYLPDRLPTVTSLLDLWSAYRGSMVPTTNAGWSFTVRPENAWCTRDEPVEECKPAIFLNVGRRVWHEDVFPKDEGGGDESSILTTWIYPERESVAVRGFSETTPMKNWTRTSAVSDLSAFAFLVDIGVWRFPGGGYAIGAGFLAFVVGFAYWSWPAVKSAIGMGLFSRVDKPHALDHPARAELAALIEASPGIHFQQVRRRLGWSPGLARHHLSKLVQLGLVTERQTSGYTCYFPHGKLDRRLIEAISALKADGARRILAFVIAHPDAANVGIARGTQLDPATVHYHVRRLVDAGLITVRQDGREVRAVPSPFAPAALDIAA